MPALLCLCCAFFYFCFKTKSTARVERIEEEDGVWFCHPLLHLWEVQSQRGGGWVLTARYVWTSYCWVFGIDQKHALVSHIYNILTSIAWKCFKVHLQIWWNKNKKNHCKWIFESCSQIQSGYQELTRPQTSHLYFQTKVTPGRTLYFGISPHWREVIMNINVYSWLFIQLLLCCLWCPVERVSKQCTINGGEQSQKNKVFFHNCLPALLCLKINLIWSLLRNG